MTKSTPFGLARGDTVPVHWVLQRGVLREANLSRLIETLQRAGSPFDVVTVDRAGHLRPDVNPSGPVIVSGAGRMASIARQKDWRPGSFLNENFTYGVWVEAIGTDLLNPTATVCFLHELDLDERKFVRPVEDSKVFDGGVFGPEDLRSLRDSTVELTDCLVAVSPVRELYREYRLFVVDGEVVTGSLYRQAGQPLQSPDVDPDAIQFANAVIARWRPADAFVVDLGLTPDGYRVVEFNNINACGFYAADVSRYVEAIESAFGAER